MREGGMATLSRKAPKRASAALRLRRRTLMDWLCSCSARISLLMLPRSLWNLPSIASIVSSIASQLLIYVSISSIGTSGSMAPEQSML